MHCASVTREMGRVLIMLKYLKRMILGMQEFTIICWVYARTQYDNLLRWKRKCHPRIWWTKFYRLTNCESLAQGCIDFHLIPCPQLVLK